MSYRILTTSLWQRLVIVALAVSASLCLPTSSEAQEATGSITGRVANVATGEYLNNARITIKGTARETFTDRFGEFRLSGVPTGSVTLVVFYTGLDSKEVTVEVTAGSTVNQQIDLTSVSRYGEEEEIVLMDEFTVTSTRETNAAAIAQNEQRFSPNLKNVVAADSFGDVTEGNVGEFMKYLPGVTVDYVAADVRTMSVRGFADNFTSISFDGARMASASSGSNNRTFEFEQISINNISRVEVTKVPTPDLPADSLGGAVNMVPKSAFERKGSDFRYKAYLSINDENLKIWEKSPGPMNKRTFKTLPGADFDWTIPVNDRLGFVVTGLTSNQFNEQHRIQKTWNFAQGGASLQNPYLQLFTLQDGPKVTLRDSASFRVDYKLAPNHVLSAGAQFNYYAASFGNRNINWDVGTTTMAGANRTWDADSVAVNFVAQANPLNNYFTSGRGGVRQSQSFRDKNGATRAANLRYTFTGANTQVEAGLNGSISKSWYRDTANGHFEISEVRLNNLGRIELDNITGRGPREITTRDFNGNVLDWSVLQNYRLHSVRSRPLDGRDEFIGYFVNVKQTLDFLPFYATVKVGVDVREQGRDVRRYDRTWNRVGPDGVHYTEDDNAFPFLDTRYGVDPYWGVQNIQWISTYKTYQDFVANPTHYVQTAAQQAASERFRKQNSYDLEETITSGFIRFDARLMENKLNIVAGVRHETTDITGNGLLTQGPAGTLDQVNTNWIERGLRAKRDYDDLYPSASITYNITDDLLARLAYAKTLGRPNFATILPLVRANETNQIYNDGIGNIDPNTAIANNTGLEPWEADNYDLALEYYGPSGTFVSGGVFLKELTGFFETSNFAATPELLTAIGLDPSTDIDTIRTTINGGDTRISGWEFNFAQPLHVLGRWGKDLRLTGNITRLDLDGSYESNFSNFIEKSGSVGLTYSSRPIVAMIKWVHRGEQRRGAQTGAAFGGSAAAFQQYYLPRNDIDINFEYQLSRKFTVFVNARRITNTPQRLENRTRANAPAQSPEYTHLFNREEYGVQYAVGIKGRF